MKTAVIIQARMGSSRFPGKNLAPIVNIDKPNPICALELIYDAAMKAGACGARKGVVDEVIIACPERDFETFQDYADWQHRYTGKRFLVFAGDENNCYGRVLRAAMCFEVDLIVDITGDCPLVPAVEIERHVRAMMDDTSLRYISNVFPERLVPDGWDVQVYRTSVMLERLTQVQQICHTGWNLAQVEKNLPQLFPMFLGSEELRITLDTPEDLAVLQKIGSMYMDWQCLDTREKAQQLLDYLLEQPPEWWDNRTIVPKIAGEG